MSESDRPDFIRTACEHLAGAADGSLDWGWDGRLDTAVAAFGMDLEPAVRSALEPHFVRCWSLSEFDDASERVFTVAQTLGGMRDKQLLWVSSDDAPIMLFCAWWPWGNGQRVSIRVGYEMNAPSNRSDLKSWFGLSHPG